MRRQLKFGAVAVAAAAHLRAVREGRAERGGHARRRDDCRPPRLLEAEDELRGHDALRLVELPLDDEAPFERRATRVRALPLAEPQLVGDVRGQVAEGG